MGMYDQFFDVTQIGNPYRTEEEAIDDIQALVDTYLNMAFYNRDLEEERLDLRGVVITPQEFRAALTDWTLESRHGEGIEAAGYRQAVIAEASRAREHVDSRMADSHLLIHKLQEKLELTWKERFCFYMALLVDRDRKYERIFGYIQDNVGARRPTYGLGISLYQSGEGGERADGEGKGGVEMTGWGKGGVEMTAGGNRRLEMHIGEWDSPLWKFLLRDTNPPQEESRLSRPMAVRDSVYRYLKGGEWLWGWWRSFASMEKLPDFQAGEEKGKGTGQYRLTVSFLGLLEALECQEDGRKYSLFEIVTTLSLAGRMTGAAIVVKGPVDSQAHKYAPYLLKLLDQEGMEHGKANSLGPCAVLVDSAFQWGDLILEDSQKELMRQICCQIQYREKVRSWGFGAGSLNGNGVSAVFYGAPGTGKTMAAQVMGNELGLDVYRIELSQLVSKYIGETEKNLNGLFEKARDQSSILFFDEADGLFAKRSSVENSNDRYANMETGYLLQKFDGYDGIVILATNFIHNIDEAFKRRIRFFVRFTFPDPKSRLMLWKAMIPAQAQVDEVLLLDMYAARFELSGSDIRSVVTNAAYIAASGNRGICNEDIKKALYVHYLKLGRKMGNGELL